MSTCRLGLPIVACSRILQGQSLRQDPTSLGGGQRQIVGSSNDRIEDSDFAAGDVTLLHLSLHRDVEQRQLMLDCEALQNVLQLVAARLDDEVLWVGNAVALQVVRHLIPCLAQVSSQRAFVATVPGLEGTTVLLVVGADIVDHPLDGRAQTSSASRGSTDNMVTSRRAELRLDDLRLDDLQLISRIRVEDWDSDVGGGGIALRLVKRNRLLLQLNSAKSREVLEILELLWGQV